MTLRLADLARDNGDTETAADHYRVVLSLAPDRQDIKVQLGNMLKDSGRLREAEEVYKDAQDIAPDDPDIFIQRGRVRKLMGDRAGALALFRQAAALSDESWDAIEEMATLGASSAQRQLYEVHLRAGGSEAILQMSRQIAAMRALLDDIAARLPDALAQTAIPAESYPIYRALHTAPPPPPGPAVPVTAILLADRETIPVLQAQLGAIASQTADGWKLLVVVSDPERRAIAEQAAAGDPRLGLVSAAADASAAAEWRAARLVTEGWLLLLAQGALLHRETLAWAAALPALAEAGAYVFDEDRGRLENGRVAATGPVFRAAIDADALLEANVAGETLLLPAQTYARLIPSPPDGSVARARGRLALALAAAGSIGHLPHMLVTRLDPVKPSLPEHRLAIADHAAATGVADRLVIARGEAGPSCWRPRDADRDIAVVIATDGNWHDLRRLVRSLREKAAVPDHIRFVVVETGLETPEGGAMRGEFTARRHATLLHASRPFHRARLNNQGAAATDAPLLVFVRDATAMRTEGWDERVRGQLEREATGALGARLAYEDETIAHAGILFDWRGSVIADGLYEPLDAPGPAGRLQLTRAVGAVSDAFLAVRRRPFEAAGGFDVAFATAFADVDLCLKLRQAALRILCTPALDLTLHERKERAMDHLMPERMARFAADLATLQARWGAALTQEPGLNPVWYAATLPCRLLSAPSAPRVLAHLRRTALGNPWAIGPPG